MDKRKAQLNNRKICRFCLSQDVSILTSLYEKSRSNKKGVNLQLQILKCTGVEVFPSDGLPSYICEYCRFFMEMSFDYKQMCRSADENVLHYLQKGDALKPMTYPGSLIKIFHAVHQTKVKDTQTLVTEEGAFVQVTSQDQMESDNDEDREVYNIKISKNAGDGLTKGTATIKVVTDRDDMKTDISLQKDGEKMDDADNELGSPETQLICELCNQLFATEEDIEDHFECHHMDEETVTHKCEFCNKCYKSEALLHRHNKRMHDGNSDEQISSMSLEDGKFIKVDSMIICPNCKLTFKTVRSLRRHEKQVHGLVEDPFACLYCPDRFDSMQQLLKHSYTHMDGTDIQCKYCAKIFAKIYNYNRHIRLCHHSKMDHSDQMETLEEGDSLRCEECDETFATQDELIYHSAIHATQNLTCPLCQEKFDNVDAVTLHIKTHVEGDQFMCDFCELVFNCKDKLDNHISEKHAEEQELLSNEEESRIEEEDDNISVRDEGDHMVVNLKKAEDFILPRVEIPQLSAVSTQNITRLSEPMQVDKEKVAVKPAAAPEPVVPEQVKPKSPIKDVKLNSKVELQLPQRDIIETPPTLVKEDKPKTPIHNIEKPVESAPTVGASDKSLKLLEKELQDLKRTSGRSNGNNDAQRISTLLRGKRSLITSTPKSKGAELKRIGNNTNEKRRTAITKENTEPKETKDLKNNNNSNNPKEEKTTDNKEKENKSAMTDKPAAEETIRRSRRSSKIKDYAKMAFSMSSDENSDDEFINTELNSRVCQRKSLGKPTRAPTPEPDPNAESEPPARKRGRPRRDASSLPSKVAKTNTAEQTTAQETAPSKSDLKDVGRKDAKSSEISEENNEKKNNQPTASDTATIIADKSVTATPDKSDKLLSGKKPVLNTMQVGSKTLKVKKILMTKAEVAKMVQDGLVEIMNGHVVVKQGVKLPEKRDEPAELDSSKVQQSDNSTPTT